MAKEDCKELRFKLDLEGTAWRVREPVSYG
jgi:hypothetical protein